MNKKLSVTVGIPAYNEEGNIKQLLLSIVTQRQNSYELKKVVVVSDGSNDRTISEIKKVNDRRIHLLIGKKRYGKPKRLNQLFSMMETDLLVQFDGDVVLKNENTIENLVISFLKNTATSIVYGTTEPMLPVTFIEKLSYFGYCVWEDAKKSLGHRADRYRCMGQIRAFSKEFLKTFKLPKNIASSEDSYSFYFAKDKHLKITCSSKSIAIFRLTTTFRDYFKQMSRYLKNDQEMEKYFNKQVVARYNTITLRVKIMALCRIFLKSRIDISISYLILQALTYFISTFYKRKPTWNISQSTKIAIKL